MIDWRRVLRHPYVRIGCPAIVVLSLLSRDWATILAALALAATVFGMVLAIAWPSEPEVRTVPVRRRARAPRLYVVGEPEADVPTVRDPETGAALTWDPETGEVVGPPEPPKEIEP